MADSSPASPMPWVALGAALAGLAVAAGAFGAHALRAQLSTADLATFDTAARYQMYHALALVAVGRLDRNGGDRLLTVAGWAFLAGIVLFSGSLYGLTLTGVRGLGAITPLGGLSFLAGWGLVALAAFRGQRS